MKYQAYQAYAGMMAPIRQFAQLAISAISHPAVLACPGMRQLHAAHEVLSSGVLTHARPEFGIDQVSVGAGRGSRPVAVHEEVTNVTPFATLLHFRKEGVEGQPRVLIVAPMSGHFASRLHGMVRAMLAGHDVYVTDWHNARDVPLGAGRFGLDEYIQHLLSFLEAIGPGGHIVAVCQACIGALAATALMAEDSHPAQPRSLTLMAGPIDPRVNPTMLNKLAADTPLEWFEHNLISTVPLGYRGALRRVYPGFLQLATLMSHNVERHIASFNQLYQELLEGDPARAVSIRTFHEQYFAVLDLAAEFYLETVQDVFQAATLPHGKFKWKGRAVRPEAIRHTALLTVEGQRDDVCPAGQTRAAHRLCGAAPHVLRRHFALAGGGHEDVFSGRCWTKRIYPLVRDTIRSSR
ncbi:MAG: poly(3-hydroxybutyrate) depolymerase [Herminiimonas sp.]|nr:poly(3-hydroxybutyrate) depolymerase [Herminiimonas sp.]